MLIRELTQVEGFRRGSEMLIWLELVIHHDIVNVRLGRQLIHHWKGGDEEMGANITYLVFDAVVKDE